MNRQQATKPEKGDPRALIRSMRFLRMHAWPAVGCFIALLVSSGSNLIIPRITQSIIDSGIKQRNLRLILLSAGSIILISLARSLFTFLQGYFAAKASQGVAFDMRNKLYSHIQHLSFSYHDQAQTGQLLTRATSDVELVRTFVGTGLIQLLSALILMVGSVVLLLRTNWRLTLIVFPFMVAALPVFSIVSRKGRPLFILAQQKLAVLNTRLQECITGIAVVKAFTRESFERDGFENNNSELYDVQLKAGRLFAFAMPLIFSLANLSTLVLVWAGGFQVFSKQLTVGELVAFQSYLMLVIFPITMLGMLAMSFSRASAGVHRIFEIIDAEVEVKNRENAAELPLNVGAISFENVGFTYAGVREPVLKDINLTVKSGQTVALLGATGSGKSTIINLIPRFYDATEGCITIDGLDIRDVTLESLRRQIGIVLQETMLFGSTIRENIAYGKPDATDKEIASAAEAAEADDFINSFPEGYDTAVGERGVTLSGGQKQRIAIARALLVGPNILILDDSTSSVDFATESKIQQALSNLRKNRISFVIAQRISTVRDADIIVVIDKGKIVAHGNHETLIHDNPRYAEIYYSQLRPDDGASPDTMKRGDAS